MDVTINLNLLTAPLITLCYAPGHTDHDAPPAVGDVISVDELHTVLKITAIDGPIVFARPYPNDEEGRALDAYIEQCLAEARHRRSSASL